MGVWGVAPVGGLGAKPPAGVLGAEPLNGGLGAKPPRCSLPLCEIKINLNDTAYRVKCIFT